MGCGSRAPTHSATWCLLAQRRGPGCPSLPSERRPPAPPTPHGPQGASWPVPQLADLCLYPGFTPRGCVQPSPPPHGAALKDGWSRGS